MPITESESGFFDEERRKMIEEGVPVSDAINAFLADEPVWDTAEMTAEFEVIGFLAPFVVVRRRSDGKRGTLEFAHSPRVYFGWHADE